ncbi:MAG: GNAT family N-acetyltransferase [Bacteroidales bacterium]|jgi:GNAT superfamily N-acetyltransferase|nr:GNAT family N-acetyltransferase [Bacteroidales bacterium]MDD4704083.1 GNAT family N-acetyltransferase [Bacteroidales bacterium]MDX9799145.1 GNAT family N-acetyltransferase [Bacteroidales bacterium]
MEKIILFNEENKPNSTQKNEIIDFLYEHLDEFGDAREDIEKAINYAIKDTESYGGFILQAFENERTSSVLVLNKTGMKGYIPENILVYIATHKELRGKGIGKRIMSKAMEITEGDIALHVEANNPAKFLYEKLGFRNKYLEMRYLKHA